MKKERKEKLFHSCGPVSKVAHFKERASRAKVRVCTHTYPLDVAGTDNFRRVDANYPLEAEFVHVKGRAVEVHQGHRRWEIEAAARQYPEKFRSAAFFNLLLGCVRVR